MHCAKTVCLLAVCGLVLAACASDPSGYPSLARRPAERIAAPDPNATPAPPPAPLPADPAQLARVADLVALARTADARFAARSGPTRSAVNAAAGAAVASEGWSVATIALSELEATRSETMIALADLDTLYARAVVEGTDSAALREARDTVIALVGDEDRVLADLHGRMRQ